MTHLIMCMQLYTFTELFIFNGMRSSSTWTQFSLYPKQIRYWAIELIDTQDSRKLSWYLQKDGGWEQTNSIKFRQLNIHQVSVHMYVCMLYLWINLSLFKGNWKNVAWKSRTRLRLRAEKEGERERERVESAPLKVLCSFIWTFWWCHLASALFLLSKSDNVPNYIQI